MTTVNVADPRESATKKDYAAVKHATYTSSKLVQHTKDAIRFYLGERKHLIDTQAQDLGHEGTTPKDLAYFDNLIKKNRDDLRLYEAEYSRLHEHMRSLKPFIQAKDWLRDWSK